MTAKEKAARVSALLKQMYPLADCRLFAGSPFELLVAVRLSAQCTDKRVNLVTPALFEKYTSLEEYAGARVSELEQIIHPCGFYHTKARDIIAAANKLIEDFGGVLPDTLDELLTIPGVGRKSANLLLGDVFGKPAVVCDTHVIRISNRLGLASSTNPEKVEQQLRRLLPPEESNDFCHRVVLFGRDTCTARSPKCDGCRINAYCKEKTRLK